MSNNNNANENAANDPDRMQTSSPTPQPSAPATPGANGLNSPIQEDRPPAPPIHRVPTNPPPPPVDAEACKAAGNKFFKAREYDRAIEEYSKGMSGLSQMIC